MPQIKIKDKVYFAKKGERLSNLLIKEGEEVEHICGGKGICGKCLVEINGRKELSCKYIIGSDIEVKIPEKERIESEAGSESLSDVTSNLCLALDVGTTTLALAVISLDNKSVVRVLTELNPQRAFGADVISRIEYAGKNGVDELQSVLIETVNCMIEKSGVKSVRQMIVAGNGAMLHLFFGVDPSSMGVTPYTPGFTESKIENAERLGIKNVESIVSLPLVAAYVGADIVAGMNFAGLPEVDKYNLLVDLGTNAEIALYSQKGGVCTSAAAGPCFEGANISCGMSAVNGAIYSFKINGGEGLERPAIKTIGNALPKGICGTGLVDIIAELCKADIIDETGFMECDTFEICDRVSINQKDIRQYQLAKSAVCSGILSLMDFMGVGFDDIEAMYISGGFSAKINIASAIKTGLLPDELKYKCNVLNNSSLLGAIKFAFEKNDLSVYIDNIKYIDLGCNTHFSELFIQNMEF